MKHPFQVGGKYRNRKGEYEVVKLEQRKMLIRFVSGETLWFDIGVQAGIWANIKAEEAADPPPPPKIPVQPPPPSPRPDRRGEDFHGLQGHDFQKGVVGTSWRRRSTLGGLLARHTTRGAGHYFESYAIYHMTEVHIVDPLHYPEDEELRKREAKFLFSLNEERANYGFYIEKNRGPMNQSWRWLFFIEVLKSDTKLLKEIQSAMRRRQLCWDICVEGDGKIAQVDVTDNGLSWVGKHQNSPEAISWSEFIGRLETIDMDKWCDLYLCGHMGKNDAIKAGIGIATPATDVYKDLLPLYRAVYGVGR